MQTPSKRHRGSGPSPEAALTPSSGFSGEAMPFPLDEQPVPAVAYGAPEGAFGDVGGASGPPGRVWRSPGGGWRRESGLGGGSGGEAAAPAVDDVAPLPLEHAAAVSTQQLEYLLQLTKGDAREAQEEVVRLRRLAKRSRLSTEDAKVMETLRERLGATEEELEQFKARVVQHKEQFRKKAVALQKKTAASLAEIERLSRRVVELESAHEAAFKAKLQIQDGAARALQAKDEEISRLRAQLAGTTLREEDVEALRGELASTKSTCAAQVLDAKRKCAAEVAAVKAECTRVVERTKLQMAQELFVRQRTARR